MIKAETHVIEIGDNIKTDIEVKIAIPVVLDDIRSDVLAAELLAVFKKLHEVDPEILLDALESYTEDIKE